MNMIQRRTAFYIGQSMRMSEEQGTVLAVKPNGDGVVQIEPDDSTEPCSCAEIDSTQPHKHIPGLFTPFQVRDAAIRSLCGMLAVEPPAECAQVSVSK